VSFRVGEGVAGWVVEHGKPALIHDVAQDPRFVALPANETPIASMICVPLIARGERVGAVTATSGKPNAFDTNNLELIRFIAMTIALDIENLRLHRVAVTDPLTGAFNREFLLQRLPLEIETATERDRALSVAMVDVDHFKTVNDHYGHGIGDLVLSEVARRLRGAIRAGDLLVRYGGEEFLAVLPKADAGRAWEVGERMRQRVCERAFEVGDGLALLLRVSIGIAQWRTGEVMPDLIERADTALYGAKDRGRNRVEVAP
jgi:diguanylate cyclase (GGDEF)-like protein